MELNNSGNENKTLSLTNNYSSERPANFLNINFEIFILVL